MKKKNVDSSKSDLPSGHDLVKLARKFGDEENKKLRTDALGFDYQILVQKNFMRIVKWLKEKGY